MKTQLQTMFDPMGARVKVQMNSIRIKPPIEVRTAVKRRVKRVKNRLRRKNKALVRLGEWSFSGDVVIRTES